MRRATLLLVVGALEGSCGRPSPLATGVDGAYGFEPNYALAFTGDNTAPSQYSTGTPPWNAEIQLGQWTYGPPSCADYASDGGGFYSGPLQGYSLTITLTTNGDFRSFEPGPDIGPGTYTIASSSSSARLAALTLGKADPSSSEDMDGVGIGTGGTVTVTAVGSNLEGTFNVTMQVYVEGGATDVYGSFNVPYCRDPMPN